jgi:hypothetical protein
MLRRSQLVNNAVISHGLRIELQSPGACHLATNNQDSEYEIKN